MYASTRTKSPSPTRETLLSDTVKVDGSPFLSRTLHLQIVDESVFKNRARQPFSKTMGPPSEKHLPKNPSKNPSFIRSQDQKTLNFLSDSDSKSTRFDVQALSVRCGRWHLPDPYPASPTYEGF